MSDTTTTLDKDILDAVERALPAIQVEGIRKALNELTELRTRNASQAKNLSDLSDQLAESRRSLSIARDEKAKVDGELESVKKERDMFKTMQRDAELAALKASLTATENTTDKFLKNTVYRESLQQQFMTDQPVFNTVYENGYAVQKQVASNRVPETTLNTKEKTTE
jgi:uncharacterized coiled-coil protein SlyX